MSDQPPVEPTTIEQAYALAMYNRAANRSVTNIYVAPSGRFAQFNVHVFDGVVGRVRQRLWHSEEAPNGDRLNIVDVLLVEVPTVSLIEAYTRYRMREIREEREGSAKMRVNRLRPPGRANTRR